MSIFQIAEYDFLEVYIGDNETERTPVHNLRRRQAIAGFEAVEWMCKSSYLVSLITKKLFL
jgi:hypothetical protein